VLVRSRLRFLAVLSAVVLPSFACPSFAWAHAILEDSTPPAGGSVHAGSIDVRLRYNSRIDRGRSRLTVIRPDHTQAPAPIAPDGPPDVMATHLDLKPGDYVLRWQVLAVDGHITRGDVPFTVTEH
jgi:methionine-rich copper-binding protein CopC